MTQSSNALGVRRRAFLGSLAAGASAGLGGCLRRVRSIAGWESMEQVTLRIKTTPADEDPYALHAARLIAEWYRAVGIDAQVVPLSEEELLRQVLLGSDFDVFLARGPNRNWEPDTFYSLLHSQYADARGWQNPFGFTDLDVDARLETQRHASGQRREEAVAELLRSIARSQPFTVLAFPDDIRAARRDTYENWEGADLQSQFGYLEIERGTDPHTENGSDSETETVLRIATTDRRPTENLNPLSVEYRRSGVLTGLLYDSIGYETAAGTKPWLADAWEFSEADDGPRATVRLRSGLTWHDGEPLTAEDIAFTYELLADTSLGSAEEEETTTERDARIPAPRFQGRAGLVDAVDVPGPDVADFEFVECSPRVATRAFTVPILPKHVWSDRTEPVSMAGIEVGRVTEALVTSNVPPVGSGPLRFVRNSPRESLVLEPFPAHFLADAPERELAREIGPPPFDRMTLQVVGSDDAAVGVVAEGDADVTGTPVGAATVPRIGRDDDLELVVNRAETPYLVGYNARTPPLSNPRFRHTLSRLVDQAHLTSAVFDGYARPGVSPLAGSRWVPADLAWDGSTGNPVTPFLGTDGEVAVQRARAAFREAGFQYDDGKLLRGA